MGGAVVFMVAEVNHGRSSMFVLQKLALLTLMVVGPVSAWATDAVDPATQLSIWRNMGSRDSATQPLKGKAEYGFIDHRVSVGLSRDERYVTELKVKWSDNIFAESQGQNPISATCKWDMVVRATEDNRTLPVIECTTDQGNEVLRVDPQGTSRLDRTITEKEYRCVLPAGFPRFKVIIRAQKSESEQDHANCGTGSLFSSNDANGALPWRMEVELVTITEKQMLIYTKAQSGGFLSLEERADLANTELVINANKIILPGDNKTPMASALNITAKEFAGVGFGVAVTALSDLKGERVFEAVLDKNNIVRSTEKRGRDARFMLESHYFWTTDSDHVGLGPFLAVSPTDGKSAAFDAIGVGVMFGMRYRGTSDNSLNFGIGAVMEPQAQVLADNIKVDQPLPVGETSIRYQKETRYGLLGIASFQF